MSDTKEWEHAGIYFTGRTLETFENHEGSTAIAFQLLWIHVM